MPRSQNGSLSVLLSRFRVIRSFPPSQPISRPALLALVFAVYLLFIPVPHLLASPSAAAEERPFELLPVDHWAYNDLRKLWVEGIIDSFFVSTRPLSRYDIAALLVSLEDSSRMEPALMRYAAVKRLFREFSREIQYLREPVPDDLVATHPYRPTPFVFQSRRERTDFRLSLYADVTEPVAREEPAREGSRVGIQAWAILRPNVVLFEDIYAGRLEDGWQYGEELFSLKDVLIFSDRFYVSLRTPFFDAEAGRDRVRWGPGRTGTLLLSDSAPSYTLLSLGKTFGKRVKFSSVTGILDSEQGKYLAAHRLDVCPADFIQIGISEAAIYHARFVEPLYALSLMPFTLVERMLHRDAQSEDPEDPTRNNVLMSADIVLRPARGLSVYGELMLDDLSEETSERPTRLAYQMGLQTTSLAGTLLNFSAELTRVWDYTYTVYYSDVYDRDFTHQGEPLGYYYAPDSRRLFFMVSTDISRDVEAGVTVNIFYKGGGSLDEPWTPELGEVDASELSSDGSAFPGLFARWLPRDNVLLETECSVGPSGTQWKGDVKHTGTLTYRADVRLAARW